MIIKVFFPSNSAKLLKNQDEFKEAVFETKYKTNYASIDEKEVVDKSEKETSDLEEVKDVEVKSVEITY